MLRVCSEYGCQDVTEDDESRWCPEHTRVERSSRVAPRGSRQAGYDTSWTALSKRARAKQPFCSDCGTTSRLTTDHLPSAWERKAQGLPIRLADVDVVCSSCNIARGSSRVGTTRAQTPAEQAAESMRRMSS